MEKLPIDVDVMLARIEAAVRPIPKAALFELAAQGYDRPFQVLVACIISIRTRDEVTLPIAKRLFARAASAEEVARLGVPEIDELIGTAAFHESKAHQIAAIARRTADEFAGELPCEDEALRSLAGVGPKCANLVLGIACGQPRLAVDVHVHRVTNRWGYVAAKTPEQTMVALAATLPQRHWVDLNRLLVPFGKHICTRRLPHCSTCPVLVYCRQVGVTAHL